VTTPTVSMANLPMGDLHVRWVGSALIGGARLPGPPSQQAPPPVRTEQPVRPLARLETGLLVAAE
jgi:hypothetical protein